jgi:regulator of protease activity HflC (stomatin/prohibitin superfamily)
MKKTILNLMLVCIALLGFSSCSFTNPGYDEEVALKMKPWFFGDTGVDPEPINNITCIALTTDAVHFSILPQKYVVKFDNILSNDNTPLDVVINISLQVKKGHTPTLLKNYGENWYSIIVEPWMNNKIRETVSRYSSIALQSDDKVIKEFNNSLQKELQAFINSCKNINGELPVRVVMVKTDKIVPPNEQQTEMARTAAAIQRNQTEERRADAEIARAKAEKNKAIADKAYMQEMNLSPAQFIQLKYIEMISNKKDANIDVLVGNGEQPMWNIRR